MNKDSTDFMLVEYDRISTAYFGLQNQLTEWFKAYVTLVGLPLTIMAAIFGATKTPLPDINDFPPIVAALLSIVSLLGFFISLTMINMRMEMILYARTINGIRRYFADIDKPIFVRIKGKVALKGYLILPTTDMSPSFFEKYRSIYWQVMLIGFLDGVLLWVAIYNLLAIALIWEIIICVVFSMFHFYVYWRIAYTNQRKWKVKLPRIEEKDVGYVSRSDKPKGEVKLTESEDDTGTVVSRA